MPKVGQDPASVIEHRGWCEAKVMLLGAASGAPRTLALIGAAGTGKTWLLRRLMAELRGRGRQVRLELRGDVSPQLPLGAVLLVDEASRLDPAALERMANQQRGLVVLADVPAFARRLNALHRPPTTITLPTIDPAEVPEFVRAWAATHEVSVGIAESAVARLVAHSEGTPRLITQLARAALALAEATGRRQIVGADIDEAAALKTGALKVAPLEVAVPPVAAAQAAPAPVRAGPPVVPVSRPGRLRWPAVAAIGTPLVAAAVLAAWIGARRPVAPAAPAPAVTQAASSPGGGGEAMAEASPPEAATNAGPAEEGAPVFAAAVPAPPPAAAPAPAPQPVTSPEVSPIAQPAAPVVGVAPVRADAPATAPLPGQAEAAPLAVASAPAVSEPAATPVASAPAVTTVASAPAVTTVASAPAVTAVAASPAPEVTASLAPQLAPEVPLAGAVPAPGSALAEAPPAGAPSAGAPGLVFLAQPGDTLASLYAQVYRGHRAPPFEAVVAANRRRVRPGTIVVFPPPSDGWARPGAVTAGRDLP